MDVMEDVKVTHTGIPTLSLLIKHCYLTLWQATTNLPQYDQENMPKEVQRQIQSLHKARIVEQKLEEKLKTHRRRRQGLEALLKPYEVRSSKTMRLSIDDLPLEFFTNILRLSLLDDHLQIRDLLLVSRRWHEIVVGTPALWTTIQICITNTIDNDPAMPQYVQVCYARSGNLPLTVIFDLYHITGLYRIAEEISKYLDDALQARRS